MDDKKQEIQIGTQILDPSLPSNLDFEQKKHKQVQGKEIDYSIKYNIKSDELPEDVIRNFTVKGKAQIQEQAQFRCGSIIKANNIGFVVKAYDEEKSGGLKKFWQSIVGYVKRELYIANGYVYLFEPVSDGYRTQCAWKISDIFKIFVDQEDNKIRLIMRPNDDKKLITKNFQSQNFQQILAKIREEIDKVGLTLMSQ